MMAAFFESQLDFIYFFYGLAFLIMAVSCFYVRPAGDRGLPWKWLGVFGVLHGACEWLLLAEHEFGGGQVLSAASSVLAAASYVFLLEFGRSGLKAVRGSGPGRWALLPFAVLACLGWKYGLPGLGATTRYFIGLPGGVWAASALWEAGKASDGRAKAPLAVAGVCMAAYALATAVVPGADFPPASLFNERAFFEALHVPVQFVRGVLAMAVAALLSMYGGSPCRGFAPGGGKGAGAVCPYAMTGAVVAAVLFGWALTDAAGRHAERGLERELLYSVANIAGSVNPERLARIAADRAGTDKADRARIQEQAEAVCAAYCRAGGAGRMDMDGRYCAHVHIRMPIGGDLTVVAGTGEHDRPVRDAELTYYNGGETWVFGPYRDGDESWVSAVAPVMETGSGRVIAQVVIDVEASVWQRDVGEHRFYGILLSLALSLFAMAFAVAWRRTKEAAARAEELRLASLRHANEKKLRDIASALGEGVYVLDTDGRLAFMNPEAERLLGWTEAELIGRDMHETLHFMNEDGSHKSREDCPVIATLRTGQTSTVEGDIFIRRDGVSFPVSYVAAPLYEDGRITGAVTAFRDISERKRAEDRMRLLQAAVEAAPDGVRILDMSGRITYSNKTSASSLGYLPEEIVGMHISELHCGPQEGRNRVVDTTREKGGWSGEAKFRHKDGREVDVWLSTSLVEDGSGWPIAMVGVTKDMTERNRAEEMVRGIAAAVSADTGEEFFRSLAERLAKALGVAYAFIGELEEGSLTRVGTKAVYAHGSFMDNFGYDLAGTPCENVVGRELCTYPMAIQALFPEDAMLVQMGAESYVGTPLFDSSGGPLGLVAVLDVKPLEDVGLAGSMLRIFAARASAEIERQQAYDRLRVSQARLAGAELVARFGSWEWRLAEDRVFWSDGLCRIFGIKPEEFDGTYQAYLGFVHPDDLQSVMDQVLSAATTFRPLDYEARIIRKDGLVRVIRAQGEVTLGPDGNPASILGTVQDITDRKAAEEEIRKFRFIVDGAGEVINLIDRDANIVYSNPASARSLGYTQEEMTRLTIHDIDPEFDMTRWPGHFAELKAGDLPLFESTHIAKDGRAIPVEIKSVYMEIGGGEYVCAFVRDIAERKALERQRSDFYAMITHDLKSPLTVILGYADMLLEEGQQDRPEDIREMAAGIKLSGRKLFRMVDDFLAISRLEAGKATFNECPVDVREMLVEVASEGFALAVRKGQAFDSQIDNGLPMSIIDKTHVYRAVTNLVLNAVNYTPDGGRITFKAESIVSGGQPQIRISVADNGPGIPAGERERIFEKYYRSPKTSGTRGSGLGLAVVKAVAAIHGGRVELSSEEGRGSEFSLVLPVRKSLDG